MGSNWRESGGLNGLLKSSQRRILLWCPFRMRAAKEKMGCIRGIWDPVMRHPGGIHRGVCNSNPISRDAVVAIRSS
jgi:hypothetical protein